METLIKPWSDSPEPLDDGALRQMQSIHSQPGPLYPTDLLTLRAMVAAAATNTHGNSVSVPVPAFTARHSRHGVAGVIRHRGGEPASVRLVFRAAAAPPERRKLGAKEEGHDRATLFLARCSAIVTGNTARLLADGGDVPTEDKNAQAFPGFRIIRDGG
ncbi:hypothetical protein DPEC_G00322530 [Dallia pectoralis]|uniref:Uncharacterized protein n=1 Tax=Dallia pectoralis TaxID=75939 RepID=A0ACC2FAJ1_DALPE|nr:hypothetical protein DPEC_G00322530 [Dallia pectoralis]